MQLPHPNTAVFAIGAADGITLIEVCPHAGKFIVIVVDVNNARRADSKRGMTLERAKARALWIAGTYF